MTVRWEIVAFWWGTAERLFGAPHCVSGPRLGCVRHFSGRSPERPHGGDLPPEQTGALPLWPSAPCSPFADCNRRWETQSVQIYSRKSKKQLNLFWKQCPIVSITAKTNESSPKRCQHFVILSPKITFSFQKSEITTPVFNVNQLVWLSAIFLIIAQWSALVCQDTSSHFYSIPKIRNTALGTHSLFHTCVLQCKIKGATCSLKKNPEFHIPFNFLSVSIQSWWFSCLNWRTACSSFGCKSSITLYNPQLQNPQDRLNVSR